MAALVIRCLHRCFARVSNEELEIPMIGDGPPAPPGPGADGSAGTEHPFYRLIDAANLAHDAGLLQAGYQSSCRRLEDPELIRAQHPFIVGSRDGQRLRLCEDYRAALGEERYEQMVLEDEEGRKTLCEWAEDGIFQALYEYFSLEVASFDSESNKQPNRSKEHKPIRVLQFPPQGYTMSTNASIIDELFHTKACLGPFDCRALDACLEAGRISFLRSQENQDYPRHCIYHVLDDVSPEEFRGRLQEHMQASASRPDHERKHLHGQVQYTSSVVPAIEVFHLTVQCFELGLGHADFNIFSTERSTTWTLNLLEGEVEEDEEEET